MTEYREITDSNLDEYTTSDINPSHPGRILDSVIRKSGDSVAAAALKMTFSEKALGDILEGRANISKADAPAIGEYAKNNPEFWLRVQKIHDLWNARKSRENGNPSPA